MNCTELELECIERTGRPEAPWSDEAEQHFAACPECRQLRALDNAVEQSILAWKRQPLPSMSTDRIVTAILSATAPSSVQPVAATARTQSVATEPGRRATSSAWITTAALAAVAVVGWGLWRAAPEPGDHSVALGPASQPAAELVPEDSSAPVTESMALLWRDVRDRSELAARSTVESLDRLPAMPGLTAPAEPAPPTTPQPKSAPPSWLSWGPPLSQQVGGALRFLSDALPEDQPPAS